MGNKFFEEKLENEVVSYKNKKIRKKSFRIVYNNQKHNAELEKNHFSLDGGKTKIEYIFIEEFCVLKLKKSFYRKKIYYEILMFDGKKHRFSLKKGIQRKFEESFLRKIEKCRELARFESNNLLYLHEEDVVVLNNWGRIKGLMGKNARMDRVKMECDLVILNKKMEKMAEETKMHVERINQNPEILERYHPNDFIEVNN